LTRELWTLGAGVGDGPTLALATPADLASCLGYRYVLEGASLGGATILKRMRPFAEAPGGVHYLRCQAQMAGHWPRFTVALNAALQAESDRLRAAGAARHLFEYFCRSLDAFTESHDPFAPR
jgi:heme oxygenase